MRVPEYRRFRPFIQLSGVFVLGMIVGSIVYNAIFHASYNKLWLENKDLKIQEEQYIETINSLKKYSKRQTVIKEINIRAEESDKAPDSVYVKEIIQLLSDELEVLRGRDVYNIDEYSKMTRIMLNKKTYNVRGHSYSVKITTMLVMEGVLQVWVDISPAPE
ncbi:hypothetical protein ACFQ3J_11730 [Paenibacillus provencensis]|uniref:Sporulation membrane protein YtrI C-terminal domain-containing protein n=1 Tax=Paenibacillus provencensis TaxID=441151 RepID=A0ABW3Q711_9BACL|nr:hypothetical protein [Paenibacillus sp. MER 78]MCM3127309.1 hypothetical protein [Paenibacillus sp. MER 78]